ncbi:hypothetical protein QJS04_geneDACA007401 [Acorus gramineus]|uniref:Uncharacterized protein n=1 Tax=Acorus gramineus TaxID=55184 RepID=A0AAV9BN29_ACOGR|nr:hypothetical protein QJS04_geneDACA007401 [Acorus gramineus]
MFDWDEDEVGNIIWGESSEHDDHVVPFLTENEENSLFSFGDQIKKITNREENNTVKNVDHGMHVLKNNISGSKMESGSHYAMNDDISGPPLQIDPWLDWLSLDGTLDDDGDCTATEMINGFTEKDSTLVSVTDNKGSSSLTELGTICPSERSQLNNNSELLAKEHDNEVRDSFLDCDWASIGDLDDVDRLLRSNDSMLENDMIVPADESISCMHSVAVSKGETAEKGYPTSVNQVDKSPGGKSESNLEEKREDITVKAGRQSSSEITPNKRDQRKSKARGKVDDKRIEKSSQYRHGVCSHSNTQAQQLVAPGVHIPASYPPPVFSQQRQLAGSESMRYMRNPNPYVFMGYGYPAHHFAVMPALPQIQSGAAQNQLHIASNNSLLDSSKNLPDVSPRPLIMTPQEKIEKLRWQQKMQAILAIQQQQQRFSHKTTCSDQSATQRSSQKNLTSDATVSDVEVEESDKSSTREQYVPHNTSTLVDGSSLEEKTCHQIQNALAKLDVRLKFCIRDSLFRLARSAKERNSTSARSSTNMCSRDEDNVLANTDAIEDRIARMPDAEAVTNPIDRTVAHLLFDKPSESCDKPAKDAAPESPDLSNPVSKHRRKSPSEDKPEESGDMEVEPQL